MDGSRALQIGSLQRRSASSHPSPWVLMLAAGIPLTLFSLLTWHLLFFWAVNPQYSYGWVVPGLAVYLFVRRCGCLKTDCLN